MFDVSNKITNQIVENPKLASLLKDRKLLSFVENEIFNFKDTFLEYFKVTTLKKFTNFNILNEIEDENLIKAKIELILSGKRTKNISLIYLKHDKLRAFG